MERMLYLGHKSLILIYVPQVLFIIHVGITIKVMPIESYNLSNT